VKPFFVAKAAYMQCTRLSDLLTVHLIPSTECLLVGGFRAGMGSADVSGEVLILFHATPVNSKESEAALETWQQLTGPLTGFAQTGCPLQLLVRDQIWVLSSDFDVL